MAKKKPLYLMRYLPKSFSSLVKFLQIFFLITPVESGMFPDELKLAEVLPVFKNNDEKDKSNYRPISILSNISKIYEDVSKYNLNEYFANFLSNYQCGFRQGFNTQHWLLLMIEKLRKNRDEKGVFAAVLTDLSKAFDCIPHQLLIAYQLLKCLWF